MTPFSRRTFLNRSVVTTLALPFAFSGDQSIQPDAPFLARAFGLTPVYDQPDNSAIGSLAPNSVHRVRAIGEWFATEHGVVPRTAMQPIHPYVASVIEPHTAAPFWAEVIAPSSAVRAYCDPHAPIQAAFGQGAVVCVRGTLTDDRSIVWYELDRGWVTAAHFARLVSSSIMELERGPGGEGILRLNIHRHLLSVSLGEQTLLQSPFYGGTSLLPTLTEYIHRQTPGDTSGLPWQMRLNSGVIVRGAWDHNRFGLPGGGNNVELPPEVAKVLYAVVLENGCTVQIEN